MTLIILIMSWRANLLSAILQLLHFNVFAAPPDISKPNSVSAGISSSVPLQIFEDGFEFRIS
ncbi:hypothetical protein [Robiginitomaculum antarcticum]|uniref:hypothetical protein n=1 Tax=Robiginitomaculum antarcticum TaxID=437507 RepID=UPI0012EA1418|nr:hypothetical protein [Robiginitomaculum antarcticum]